MKKIRKTKALNFLFSNRSLDRLSPKSFEILAYLLTQPCDITEGKIISDVTYDDLCNRYGITKAAISTQMSKLEKACMIVVKRVRRESSLIILGELNDEGKPCLFYSSSINLANKIPKEELKSDFEKLKDKMRKLYGEVSDEPFNWGKVDEKLLRDILEGEKYDEEKILKYYKHFLDYGDICARFKYTNKSPKTFCVFYESMPYLYTSTHEMIPSIEWVLESSKVIKCKNFFHDEHTVDELSRKVHRMTHNSDPYFLNELTAKLEWFMENHERTSAKYTVPSIEIFLKTLHEVCGIIEYQHEQGYSNIELTELFN